MGRPQMGAWARGAYRHILWGSRGIWNLHLEEQGVPAVIEGHSRLVTESGLSTGVPVVARQGTRRWQRAGRRLGGCKERPGSRGRGQKDRSLMREAEGQRERMPGEARDTGGHSGTQWEGEAVLAGRTGF